MTDQPTPPSSLEEARKELRAAEHRWATYLATAQERSEIIAALDKATADLEIAARAEVIREVEALAEDALTLSIMLAAPKSARTEGYEDIRDLRAHAATRRVLLRALSQGGEGKA